MDSPLIIVRYKNGSAYYTALRGDWKIATEKGIDVQVKHLLSRDSFDGNPDFMEEVKIEDISKSYLMDAIAYNPVMVTMLPPEFEIEKKCEEHGVRHLLNQIGEIFERSTDNEASLLDAIRKLVENTWETLPQL